MRNDWLKELKAEELPQPYRDMAESIGIEAVVTLAEDFGGMTWYFPKIERAVIPYRNAKMKREFDGTNYRDLARKYKLSESQVRSIVDVKDDRQIPLAM